MGSQDQRYDREADAPTDRLEPRADRLTVVRWVRADGRDVEHRYFVRGRDARRFYTRLRADGRDARLYRSAVLWEAVS